MNTMKKIANFLIAKNEGKLKLEIFNDTNALMQLKVKEKYEFSFDQEVTMDFKKEMNTQQFKD